MRYTLAALALAAVAYAVPQGVTSAIAPKASAPAGCKSSYSGTFEIEVVNVTSTSKRSIEAREESSALVLTLDNGVLKDAKGRTGYIADNQQFQFDGPAQTGAIYTSGWSICANGTLALGGSTIFQQCLSGGFYNLYLTNTAAQCSAIYIHAIGAGSMSASASASATATPSAAAAASQIPDGQVTASAVPHPICQLGDGQPQATECAPSSTSASAKPVSQISDGQIQATSAASAKPTTSAAPAAPVTQIPDGQVQGATSAKATTSAAPAAPVSQIPDGQVQGGTAAKSTAAVPTVSAAPSASSTRAASAYTGAAVPTAAVRSEVFGLAAGVLALAML